MKLQEEKPLVWMNEWRSEASPTSADELNESKLLFEWTLLKEYPTVDQEVLVTDRLKDWMKDFPFEVEPLPTPIGTLSRWIDEL